MKTATLDRLTVTKKRFITRQVIGGVLRAYDYKVYFVEDQDRRGKRVRKQFPNHDAAILASTSFLRPRSLSSRLIPTLTARRAARRTPRTQPVT